MRVISQHAALVLLLRYSGPVLTWDLGWLEEPTFPGNTPQAAATCQLGGRGRGLTSWIAGTEAGQRPGIGDSASRENGD